MKKKLLNSIVFFFVVLLNASAQNTHSSDELRIWESRYKDLSFAVLKPMWHSYADESIAYNDNYHIGLLRKHIWRLMFCKEEDEWELRQFLIRSVFDGKYNIEENKPDLEGLELEKVLKIYRMSIFFGNLVESGWVMTEYEKRRQNINSEPVIKEDLSLNIIKYVVENELPNNLSAFEDLLLEYKHLKKNNVIDQLTAETLIHELSQELDVKSMTLEQRNRAFLSIVMLSDLNRKRLWSYKRNSNVMQYVESLGSSLR